MKKTVLLLSLLLFSSHALFATIVTFSNKQEFLNATSAIEHALPSSGSTSFPVGTLTVSNGPNASAFVSTGFTARMGREIAISGPENLNININGEAAAFGFDFVEPENDPNVNGGFVDSIFTVILLHNEIGQDSFTFNAPNDTLAFVGVQADFVFDRVEILETTGGVGNEFYGNFYTSGSANALFNASVPEPSSYLLGLLALGMFFCVKRRQK